MRGKWILDNILNAPPPPPPANVPPLPESEESGRVLSMRERMEAHRNNPVCANCHQLFDPIGLAMENFDAVGRWRERDGGSLGVPIDASGELLDGTKVDGVVSLRRALLRQPELFVGTVVEKLMTYALGRGVAADDMPSVRAIIRDAAAATIGSRPRARHRQEHAVHHAHQSDRRSARPGYGGGRGTVKQRQADR